MLNIKIGPLGRSFFCEILEIPRAIKTLTPFHYVPLNVFCWSIKSMISLTHSILNRTSFTIEIIQIRSN